MNKEESTKLLQDIKKTLQKMLVATQDSLIVELLNKGIPQTVVREILGVRQNHVTEIGKKLNKAKKYKRKPRRDKNGQRFQKITKNY